MDDIIQKLVDFDKECAARVEAAKQKKAEATLGTSDRKNEIYQDYIHSQQDKINQHKQDLVMKNQEKALQQQQEFESTMQKLDSLYQKNKEQWVEELYNRCIQ